MWIARTGLSVPDGPEEYAKQKRKQPYRERHVQPGERIAYLPKGSEWLIEQGHVEEVNDGKV